ncbi:aminotransferase class I/II-fold pyridoxal phosphate-dependent enzyme [Aeoliella sp. ICT_H6.2]|uniref:Aminotransferase n=1 Tax=Aeoliella straminimaris TaxID=2954799 RepID=A0A9X2FEL5_9BACT|nr:aminotransferase class I/II-fold pyridoxal phosphate-dependent enzyme [Aeoliella straminimaris]MCO6047732.1 aminotransferase class I/II-fold pyridoxal phosphate-dependent enzyme [Aeoliella straminimaris]
MHPWIAKRTEHVDSSGIRKVFDLAAKLANPINLSIGQPDFAVPDEIKQAAIQAINDDHNGYSLTQGVPALRERLQAEVDARYGHDDRRVLVTSGTSGALVLALMAMVDPGDEVICFDPYFVMYPALAGMVGGKVVKVDTYPDFHIDLAKVEAAITPRTKAILFNTPANPTGALATADEARGLAELAAKHNVAIISDEIYRQFCYDGDLVSPASYNDQTIVVDGFSKTYGVTGWRLGFMHGPTEVIEKMTMLQQYTFVCAPQPLQWSMLAAMDVDMQPYIDTYRHRRDLLVNGLRDTGYEVAQPGGAFYVFPKAPWGTGSEFVAEAIARELLIIPGNIFSGRDTHFRISYAATEETIERGLEVLRDLAKR